MASMRTTPDRSLRDRGRRRPSPGACAGLPPRPRTTRSTRFVVRSPPESGMRMHPRNDVGSECVIPGIALCQTAPQQQEIGLTAAFAALVKRAKADSPLRHHVERKPGAVAFAIAIPMFELLFAVH